MLPKTVATYVINCDQHKERLKSFRHMAREHQMGKVKRIPCANGKEMDQDDVCWITQSGWLKPNNNVNKIEFSICLSHFRAWKDFLSTQKQYALIFEDDVKHVNPHFAERLSAVLSGLEERKVPFDAIWLYDGDWMKNHRQKEVRPLFPVALEHKNLMLYAHERDHNPGANCYLITRDFARHLMEHLFPLRYPVDVYMGDQVLMRPGRPHITFNLKRNRCGCLTTPFVWMECGGAHGTGESTQDYSLPKLSKIMGSCQLHRNKEKTSALRSTIKQASSVMKR